MSTNLQMIKDCPFCGSNVNAIDNDYYSAWVSCRQCGASGQASLKSYEHAVTLWNERQKSAEPRVLAGMKFRPAPFLPDDVIEFHHADGRIDKFKLA